MTEGEGVQNHIKKCVIDWVIGSNAGGVGIKRDSGRVSGFAAYRSIHCCQSIYRVIFEWPLYLFSVDRGTRADVIFAALLSIDNVRKPIQRDYFSCVARCIRS